MKPKGTIYEGGRSATHGELILLLPRVVRAIYYFLRGTGAGMIAFAVLLFMFSYGPILSQEFAFRFNSDKAFQNKIEDSSVKSKDYSAEIVEANEILAVQKE